jgi:hypothetical protein
VATERILPVHQVPARSASVHFYELHEGDNDVFSDVLLAHEEEYEPDEFFELVQSIRRRIQDSFSHDTLVESIAVELEREHGFVFVSDDRLTAAVNVSRDDEENFLVPTGRDDDENADEPDDADETEDVDFITIQATLDPDLKSRTN